MDIINTYIYGASGHGKVILDILEANGIRINGFIDDDASKSFFESLPVLRYEDVNPEKVSVILGIGTNKTRRMVASRINCRIITAFHPSAIISPKAFLENGTVVMQLAVVQPGTSIGYHCIVNTKASIDHDCTIGDFVHISPGATVCGNVTIGDLTWVGAGTTIIQGISIGNNVIIGAGSVVLKNIPDS
jgi:sugar O-acyltransferase (sialic acid O-acetyltransferase NeuD family)